MENFYKDKRILVTGGVGSIGFELVRKLLKYDPKVIRILDNNETGLFDTGQELGPKKIRLFVGDVRDKTRLNMAMEDTDIVFHAAALKHVPLCEYNPFEAIQTNVLGSQNVIEAALENNLEKVVNISTDKAVNPTNVLGATKLLAERLITAANSYKGAKKRTVFASVRFGNVLDSRGSVLPLFKQQIKKKFVMVTNPGMTRFFMPKSKAIELVLRAGEMAKGGEIFILKMPAVQIADFVKVAIDNLAPQCGYSPKEIKIKIIGERAGEKTHEELMTEEEALTARETEDMFILSQAKANGESAQNLNSKNLKNKGYFSNTSILDIEEIKKLLREV
tara:strand:+ start:3941 stop:4942 length:1002 start_codon:yes stop_codon:yes gene_type:complete